MYDPPSHTPYETIWKERNGLTKCFRVLGFAVKCTIDCAPILTYNLEGWSRIAQGGDWSESQRERFWCCEGREGTTLRVESSAEIVWNLSQFPTALWNASRWKSIVEKSASVKKNPFSHGGNFSCTLPQKLRANEHSARELLFNPSLAFKATAAPEHSLKSWWTLYKEESKPYFEWSCPLHKRTCSSFNPSQRLLQPIQDLFIKWERFKQDFVKI